MLAFHILPDWSPQTWFDLVLCIATLVEAVALWFLYKLERRQDKRNTRVELPIRLYEYTPENEDGAQTGPAQPMIEVMNCSATAVYIEKVRVQSEIENRPTATATYGAGKLVKPYSTETINVVLPMQSVVGELVRGSGAGGDSGRPLSAWVQVDLTYRAYGKVSYSEPVNFKGEIHWGEFHPR